MNSPMVVSYGGGTNSTALLVELEARGIRPDAILFADTGSERPHTYKHMKRISQWLIEHGMPEITVVRWIRQDGSFRSIEDQCLERGELPSKAYGYAGCTSKWKIQPMNKWVRGWKPAIEAWAKGQHITRVIGFDADESHRSETNRDGDEYRYWYPLVEWEMGRDECMKSIAKAGLPQPGKSSCFFCPHMRSDEVRHLAASAPELAERALAIEANASPRGSVKGLGRRWAWSDLLATPDLFENFPPIHEEPCGACYDGD